MLHAHRSAPLLAALAALVVLPACESTGGVEELTPGQRFGIERQRQWDELKRLKAEIRWGVDGPTTFSFPEHGEVTVRDWALEGGPGWEYVRAKFTYHNTTDRAMDRVNIVLKVLDGEGREVMASRVRLTHPFGLPLAPDTFFSDEIRVPTGGAHHGIQGWHWKIDCEAVPDPDYDDLYRKQQPPASRVGF